MADAGKPDVDGGWAWWVFFGSFMNLLLASGIAFVSGIFQKLFLEEFGESVAFTAWVTALFSSLMQLAGPVSGLLMSATNCRVTVMLGGTLLSLGLAASYFATSLAFLFVTFGLIAGTGLGLMYSPSIVIVNFFFDRRRTVIMGLVLSASGVGIVGAPILSRFLIDTFRWQETLMILACISAHVCVFGALMFPIHEPASLWCLSLLRRCGIGGKEAESVEGDGGWNGSTEQDAIRGNDVSQEVPENTSVTEGLGPEGFRQGSAGAGTPSKPRIDPDSNLNGADEQSTPLLRKAAGPASDGTKDRCSVLAPCSRSNNSTDAVSATGSPLSSPNGFTDAHFGSRKSLNHISHQLHLTRTQEPHEAVRQLSSSAHNVHRPHGKEAREETLAGSLLTVQGPGSLKGSVVDTRTLSAYSSIQSLYSIGLPSARELVALSPDLQGVEDGEVHDLGGGESDVVMDASNLAIFKNIPFLFLCLNLILSNMACGIFNIHFPAFSQERGLDDQQITFVLAMDGLCCFLSRILVGALGHDDKVDKLVVYFGLYLIASFVQMAMTFATNLASVTAFAMLFGVYYGSVYSLLTSLTISVVGLHRLAFAFGVEMISAGLGFLVAPPLAGWVVDETGDYDNSMILGGFLMLLSAVSLLCLTCGRAPGSPAIGYQHPATPKIQPEARKEENNV